MNELQRETLRLRKLEYDKCEANLNAAMPEILAYHRRKRIEGSTQHKRTEDQQDYDAYAAECGVTVGDLLRGR